MDELNIIVEMIKAICRIQGTDIKQEIVGFKAAGYSLSKEAEELLLSA